METLTQYAERKNLRVEVIGDSTFEDHDELGRVWFHERYTVRVHFDGRHEDFKWMQGLAVKTTPSEYPVEVLSSLITDAWAFHNFDSALEMANEYGFDPDDQEEMKAVSKLWRELEIQAPKIIDLLGGEEELGYVACEIENDV